MGLDSIPPKRGLEDADALHREWVEALEVLQKHDEDRVFLMITSKANRERLEKYIADNHDLLSDEQRRFLLASLRVKFEKEEE